jgi:hypothetical protein
MVSLREDLTGENRPPAGSGIERTGMLDAFAHDTREDLLVLAMFETRPWEHGELQLFQLQEKLNAYVSFILDGEMKENFPHLFGKPVRIELRTSHEPPQRAMEFLGRARDQLGFQQIGLEVVLIGEQTPLEGGCCGGGGSTGGCCGGGHSHAEEHGAHDPPHHHHEGGCCGGSSGQPQASSHGESHGSCGCAH